MKTGKTKSIAEHIKWVYSISNNNTNTEQRYCIRIQTYNIDQNEDIQSGADEAGVLLTTTAENQLKKRKREKQGFDDTFNKCSFTRER